MANTWFRLYSEAITDPKLRLVASQANVSMAEVVGLWTIVLSIASSSPHPGALLIGNAAISETDLSQFAGCNVTETLQKMLHVGLISHGDAGEYIVTNWHKRQFSNSSSTERVRRHRKQRTTGEKQQPSAAPERYGNVTVTPATPTPERFSNAPEDRIQNNTLIDRLGPPTPITAPIITAPSATETGDAAASPSPTANDQPAPASLPPLPVADPATAQIADAMHNAGIVISPFTVERYTTLAAEIGVNAVLQGIHSAAQNGKAHAIRYVETVARNIASGASPRPPQQKSSSRPPPLSKVEASLAAVENVERKLKENPEWQPWT